MNQETSPQKPAGLRVEEVERLFAAMLATFGNRCADLWAGTDAAQVKRWWARNLPWLTERPDVLGAVIEMLPDEERPPDLPRMRVLARSVMVRLGNGTAQMLDVKPVPRERALGILAEAKRRMAAQREEKA